jgi:hypothetical protein
MWQSGHGKAGVGDSDPSSLISHYFISRFDTQTLDRRTANRCPSCFVDTLLSNQLMNRTHTGIGSESLGLCKLDSPTASYSKKYLN